jgi:outer membrane protein OmpA-like peptidoglycan-associated protein
MIPNCRPLFILILSLFLTAKSFANVVGADTQNFNPTTDGLDFVTVHSSETLQPGIFNLGLFLNYAVNTLPNYIDQTTQRRTKFSDTLLSSDLNFGVGLGADWDAGASFPQVLAQHVDSDNVPHGQFEQTGMTEVRLNSKYRLWGDQSGGFAMVGSANFNLISNNPYTGRSAGTTYNVEAAYDHTIGKVAVGGNLGYRFRDPGKPVVNSNNQFVEPLDDQYIASVAASYLLTSYDLKLISEIFGAFPATKQKFTSDRKASSAELLMGVKKDYLHNLSFHAGAGTELIHGVSAPDWRIYTGINWNFGPLWGQRRAIVKKSEALAKGPTTDPFAGAPKAQETFVGRDILFDFGSSNVRGEVKEVLQRLVDYLKRPPAFKKLMIVGHTDSVGSEEYNQKLSEKRASAVYEIMIHQFGLEPGKVSSMGKGETEPIADNGNFQGRALNRRVEFKVQR